MPCSCCYNTGILIPLAVGLQSMLAVVRALALERVLNYLGFEHCGLILVEIC